MGHALETFSEDIVQQTSTIWEIAKKLATPDVFVKLLGIITVLLIYFIIFRIVRHGIKKINYKKLSENRKMIMLRLVRYIYFIACIVYILSLFGIKLHAIWGAAGIAGIAIGFAAQTTVSNFISGLLILTEKSFTLGDTIIVDDITGIVDYVGLLSVKVHTFDNQLVRIPSSSLINSVVINNSANQNRRLTIEVNISYKTDMQEALQTLLKAPAYCPSVINDPEPSAWFNGFGDSGINMVLAIWFEKANLIAAKNEAYIAIKKVFDEANIEIPFNQIVIHEAK